MWIQAGSLLLLLLACCPRAAEAQSDGSRTKSIWDDPITFSTQANDSCAMIITGHREYTRVRLSCQGSDRSYWCEYVGKPYICRSYNKNPRHYFVQMTWVLRKFPNACEAPRQIKPHMCRTATDDSQMVFSSASFSRPWQEASPGAAARPTAQPQPIPTRPDSVGQAPMKSTGVPPREKTQERTTVLPLMPQLESNAKRMAQQHCWRSLQGVCSFVIGLFQN